jgi:hypothetical protein
MGQAAAAASIGEALSVVHIYMQMESGKKAKQLVKEMVPMIYEKGRTRKGNLGSPSHQDINQSTQMV